MREVASLLPPAGGVLPTELFLVLRFLGFELRSKN